MPIEFSEKDSWLFCTEYPVLGIRVLIKTDIEEISQMAESRFGHWRNLSKIYISPNPPVIVTIYKSSISSIVSESSTIQYKVDMDYLSADAVGVIFSADRRCGKAEAFVNPAIADLSDSFKINVLECMILYLVTSADREPLHASTVIRNQTALLIYGNSGSGKSTLAYSLYKRGADILADSATYISTENGFRLWGDPFGFNFKPNARDLFPELLNIQEQCLPKGRIRIPFILPSEAGSGRLKLTFSSTFFIIFPEQIKSVESRIFEISRTEMIKRLSLNRESGFDLSDKFEKIISNLPVIRSYKLEAGDNLLQTTEILESLFYLTPNEE